MKSVCTKKNRYSHYVAVSEESRHLHRSHALLHSYLPSTSLYLSARWSEGLTKEERRVGRNKWEARLRCGEKVRKMNLTLCSIEKWWVGRENRWDEKKIERVSRALQYFYSTPLLHDLLLHESHVKLSDWLRKQASAWDLPLANYITNSAG